MNQNKKLKPYITQVRGIAFKPSEISTDPFPGSIAVLKANNITNDGLDDSKLIYIDAKRVREEQIIRRGDLLLAASSGSKKVIGKNIYFATDSRFTFGAFCKVVRPKGGIHPPFLKHFFQTPYFRQVIEKSVQGANISNLKNEHLDELLIPRLPLEDQKRIAYFLSKVEGLIAQRKQHLQQLDDLLKSVFLDMFSPSCPNYADWPIVPISELAASHKRAMRTGPFGSNLLHSEFTEVGDVAVLGIDNAVNNKFEWGRRRFISDEKYKELKNYRIYPGDVIVTIMGTIGRSAVIPEDIPLAINTKHLAAITVDRKITNAVYLSYSIHSSPHIRKQLARKDRGAIMSGLNLTLIKETLIPRPPIKRQDEFAQIHNRILALKTRYDASIEHLQTLNDALASLAFKGELDLSQIVLEPWPAEDEATAQEEVATLESSFELPMPVKKKVNSPKSRKTALKNWLSAYSMHLGDAPVEADSFIALVQQKLSDLESDSDIEWYSHEIGIEEYDEMKKWIFEELKSNRLSQNYDDETNRVRVSAAKE